MINETRRKYTLTLFYINRVRYRKKKRKDGEIHEIILTLLADIAPVVCYFWVWVAVTKADSFLMA